MVKQLNNIEISLVNGGLKLKCNCICDDNYVDLEANGINGYADCKAFCESGNMAFSCETDYQYLFGGVLLAAGMFVLYFVGEKCERWRRH